MKYITLKISGIITQVAVKTDTPAYTIGVIEAMMPSDEELTNMSQKQCNQWAKVNNEMMKAICKFMNDNNIEHPKVK